MRILVAAATGFIGGHAARAFLSRGDEVYAFVRSRARGEDDPRLKGSRFIEGTLGAPPEEALSGPFDAVVYAAGVWRRDDSSSTVEVASRCDDVYVRGVEALAERALAWKAHFLFLSGVSRYGDLTWRGELREDAPAGRLSIYGAHKRKSEAILERLGARGLRWTAIVPPEVYGAHDPGGYVRFVYDRVRARRFVLIGRGENRWALCNVHNVASAILHMADRDGAGPLHTADARPSSQSEIATALARALGRQAWFPRVPRSAALAAAAVNALIPRPPGSPPPFSPKHVRVRTATMLLDTSRATALGHEPRWGLEEGAAEAVRWWESERRD
jgi:nucleoside-diphosphate-sugar epimerase